MGDKQGKSTKLVANILIRPFLSTLYKIIIPPKNGLFFKKKPKKTTVALLRSEITESTEIEKSQDLKAF